mmetsp:Transcript_18288/g.41426  ORF Transcript_18288/g.41426 Transcript_18288/m.41426 type:complete len:102 (+) Transcript_18288:53-358(+)
MKDHRNLLPLLLLLAHPVSARRRRGHHRTTWGSDADGHGGSMPRVQVASQPAPPTRRRRQPAGENAVVVTVRVKGDRGGSAVTADGDVEEKRFFLLTTRSS